MSIVSVAGATKDYQQGKVTVRALRGVDLEIESGDFLAIAGPSGSGKTTLLNCIGGLDDLTTGSIHVGDVDLSGMKQRELAKLRLDDIGFIFQAYNLIPVLSAVENVEFIMQLQGLGAAERRKQALDILDKVGLSAEVNRRPTEMSGGQQQRVAVARAIVSKPKIVLADEPTANLDSKTGSSLLDMMRQLNEEEGVTFIFSTHDKMVMEYSRRLVRVKDGQVESDETRN
jgi:putative ABC transport system ATP-binding protein